jgi:hypothetical protein
VVRIDRSEVQVIGSTVVKRISLFAVLAMTGAALAEAKSPSCANGTREETNEALAARWCADGSGRSHGWWIRTYPSGMPMLAGHDVRGKHDGRWMLFHDNGQPQEEQFWKAGAAVSTWLGWHRNGSRAWSISYENDNEVRRSCWDESGISRPCPKSEDVDDETGASDKQPSDADAKTRVAFLRKSLEFFGGKRVIDATIGAARTLCGMQDDQLAFVKRFVASCPGAVAVGLSVGGELRCNAGMQIEFQQRIAAGARAINLRQRSLFTHAAAEAATLPNGAEQIYQEFAQAVIGCYCPDEEAGQPGACRTR